MKATSQGPPMANSRTNLICRSLSVSAEYQEGEVSSRWNMILLVSSTLSSSIHTVHVLALHLITRTISLFIYFFNTTDGFVVQEMSKTECPVCPERYVTRGIGQIKRGSQNWLTRLLDLTLLAKSRSRSCIKTDVTTSRIRLICDESVGHQPLEETWRMLLDIAVGQELD